jgi:hypothetical protein
MCRGYRKLAKVFPQRPGWNDACSSLFNRIVVRHRQRSLEERPAIPPPQSVTFPLAVPPLLRDLATLWTFVFHVRRIVLTSRGVLAFLGRLRRLLPQQVLDKPFPRGLGRMYRHFARGFGERDQRRPVARDPPDV